MTQTRRERLRIATVLEIKDTARQQMLEQGTAALSLRAIARQMDMSVAALYRYFSSRDDLITALIVDSFSNLGVALTNAYESHQQMAFREQFLNLMRAYRCWAIEHPIEYVLILGNPIPGYNAPMAVTQPIAQQAFEPLSHVLFDLWSAGAITIPVEYEQLPESIVPQLQIWSERFFHTGNVQVTSQIFSLLYFGIVIWSRLHGMVTLELFNQLEPMIGNPEAFFEHEGVVLLKQLGID